MITPMIRVTPRKKDTAYKLSHVVYALQALLSVGGTTFILIRDLYFGLLRSGILIDRTP